MTRGRLAFALSGAVAIALAAIITSTGVVHPAAMPGGAGPASAQALPPLTAAQLIASVRTARPGPMAATVRLDTRFGVGSGSGTATGSPAVGTTSADGSRLARLWTDGAGRRRISVPDPQGERTLVDDGRTLWSWDSVTRTVTRTPARLAATPVAPLGPVPFGVLRGGELLGNPADATAALLTMLAPDSTARVDPTAVVADRPAYQLVLDPVPTERTMLREIRVAVDAQTRLPLEVSVMPNGSTEPALRIGFSQVSFGAQDPGLFRFEPAVGVRVLPAVAARHDTAPTMVGTGWDTVMVRRMPADPAGLAAGGGGLTAAYGPGSPGVTGAAAPGPAGAAAPGPTGAAAPGATGAGVLGPEQPDGRTAGTVTAVAATARETDGPISGPWGRGRLVSSPLGNTVITSDGRVASGAVPAQVLIAALTR
ncbi:MAG TPA: hypothetical protein VGH99_23120 [Pseudonocardia sp.]